MSSVRRMLASAVAICGIAVSSATLNAQKQIKPQDLPAPVKKTFDTKFPNARIDSLEVEEEGGVMVYDFEFRDGKREKEADIAADGTMLERTLVITTKSVPKEAMKPIHDAAEGATMGRTEKISVRYETKDGKVVKLAKPEIHYAVVLKKGEMSTEICVNADGKVLEAPKWEVPKAK